jgi:hypothetical protein
MQLCAQLYFWHGERETVRKTDRQTEIQIIYIKTDRQTDRNTDNIYKDRQTDGQTDRQRR